MPKSEEQWELIGYCARCSCPVYMMDGKRKWTGKDCEWCELDLKGDREDE